MHGVPRVLVAGAGGGIGRAIAARLATSHTLMLVDRDSAALEATSVSLPDGVGDPHTSHVADLSDPAEVAALFTQPAGPPRGLAIAVGTTSAGSLHEVDLEDWHACLASCLTPVFLLLREATRWMGSGSSICVLGSVHAAQPVPGFAAYAAAKAGVAALARQAAGEYGPRGIRVNTITPGWTETAHTSSRLQPGDLDRLLEATPLREAVQPADIAAAVDFLLSDSARHITGADLVIDGGTSGLPAGSVLRPAHRQRLGLAPLPPSPIATRSAENDSARTRTNP